MGSIHSLILHIGIHHGMVRKLSSNSKSILKRKILVTNSSSSNAKLKAVAESPSKSKDGKEKNSLYKASLMKKKLANGPETFNANNVTDSIKQSPKKHVKLEDSFTEGRPETSSTPSSGRKVPCGTCVKCQLPDCGACPQCVGAGPKVSKKYVSRKFAEIRFGLLNKVYPLHQRRIENTSRYLFVYSEWLCNKI